MTPSKNSLGMRRGTLIAGTTTVLIGVTIAGAHGVAVAIDSSERQQAIALVEKMQLAYDIGKETPDPARLWEHGDGGVDPRTVRDLGVDETTVYWAGVDARNQICLLAQPVGDSDLLASSCVPLRLLETDAIPLTAQSVDWRTEAYLLPSGTDTSDLAPGWRAIGQSLLVVVDPVLAGYSAISLDRLGVEGKPDDMGSVVIDRVRPE